MKIIQPSESVKMLADRLYKGGFLKLHRSQTGSYYFGKRNTPFKVRVSDHPNISFDPTIKVDVVLNYPSIEANIDYLFRDTVKRFAPFENWRNKNAA